MSFEVCERGAFQTLPAIAEGECSINRTGALTLLAADLLEADIGPDAAVVLFDRDTMRIGLRRVRPGEETLAMKIATVARGRRGGDSGRRALSITRALKRIGVTPAAAAGRYELLTKDANGEHLLIVALAGERVIPAEIARLDQAKALSDRGRALHEAGERRPEG